jgi:hypothetical protein
MSLIANDILTWIEQRILCEDVVNAVLPGTISPGPQTVGISDPSLYPGALVIVGSTAPEVVNVTAYDGTNITATFVNFHPAGEPVVGATFPRGNEINDDRLFYQLEILAYLGEITNDFMLKTWPVYNIVQELVTSGTRYYSSPTDAIRIERMSRIDPARVARMYNVSASDLDMMDPVWPTVNGKPTAYFEDQLNTGQFGVYPLPLENAIMWAWYSQRSPAQTLWNLMTPMPIPDPLCYIPYYGVLARMFGKDGEMRDPGREQYCRQRYQGGVEIVVRLLEGLQVNMLPGPAPPQGMARAG